MTRIAPFDPGETARTVRTADLDLLRNPRDTTTFIKKVVADDERKHDPSEKCRPPTTSQVGPPPALRIMGL